MTFPIEQIAGFPKHIIDATFHLSYLQVEAQVKQLAAHLLAEFGSDVRYFRYKAIPRGGLIVLGMLAYILNLERKTFSVRSPNTPLIIVDDCSLSGIRFHNTVRATKHQKIIFAHLYSNPSLRNSIENQEPRVIKCLAASDLQDMAPNYYKEKYHQWQQRWQQHQSVRYWLGLPELVIFPWSEPDFRYWNPVIQGVESNWRLTSPDRCLKNWGQLGLPPVKNSMPQFRSAYQVAYTISEKENEIILCDLQTEQVYGLKNIAADMWRTIVAYGNIDIAAKFLSAKYDVKDEILKQDLMNFVDELIFQGLLESIQS